MRSLKWLIGEAHRRSLWQVLGVYLVCAWVVWQVVGSLYEWIGLPDWVPGAALVLLLIGLPIVLATAFVQEGAPGLGADERRDTVAGLETTGDAIAPEHRGREPARAVEPEPGWAPAAAGPKPRAAGLFTWPKAVTGGVLAFAALGLAASGFMGMRALGIGPAATLISSGVLAEREPLVLAEFEALTGDTALAAIATQAFRIDMEQSPTVRLAGKDRVAAVLERMQRPPETPIDEELAREVALRGGMKAFIAGDVSTAGSAVVFAARILSAGDGEVLAAYRETARDSTGIVDAIDRLSDRVRSKIGESLRSVRAAPRLADITSPSLAAIRVYMQGEDEISLGNFDRGIELLREAVTLDTAFAFAYRKLATQLHNMGQTGAAYEAVGRALDHPERLTEFERLHAEAAAGLITGDPDRGIRAYEALLEVDSTDFIALNNAALLYGQKGEFERAAEYALRNLRVYEAMPEGAVPFAASYTNAAEYLFAAGRAEEADSVLRLLKAAVPGSPHIHYGRGQWASAHGRYDEAAEHARAAVEARPGSLGWQRGRQGWLGTFDAIQGRLSAAGDRYARAQALSERLGLSDDVMVYVLRRARLAGMVAGDTARARALIAEAREIESAVAPEDYPYPLVSAAYAWAGSPDSARAVLDRLGSHAPDWLRRRLDPLARAARAQILIADGRPAEAIPLLDALVRDGGTWLGHYALRGLANEMLGRTDAATAAYRAYLDTPKLARAVDPNEDALFRALALERLGRLYEESGDITAARTHHAAFVDLWHDADPELQPRVEAARRALARLSQEGGR